MNRLILKTILLFIVISIFAAAKANCVDADWWERPSDRPTIPSYERNLSPLPTYSPLPTQETPTVTSSPLASVTPTSSQPTPTGSIISTPTQTPAGGEDSCKDGESYYGAYCGWSPGVGGEGGSSPRIGGVPVLGQEGEILGLSDTAGYDLAFSDIIFLIGILCLLLYVRSKLVINQSLS